VEEVPLLYVARCENVGRVQVQNGLHNISVDPDSGPMPVHSFHHIESLRNRFREGFLLNQSFDGPLHEDFETSSH